MIYRYQICADDGRGLSRILRGKRKAESGKRKAESGKRKAESGKRKAESGKRYLSAPDGHGIEFGHT